MRFRVLGPLQAESDGRRLHLGGPRQRAVLAALLSSPNQTLSRSRLIELVWDKPAPSAEANLRSYISKLRALLGESGDDTPRLLWDQGFRLRVEPGELDLWDFDRHVELGRLARGEGRTAEAAADFARALALVRGEPYQDVVAGTRFDGLRAALQDRLDEVAEQRIDLDMDLGAHAELVGELRTRLVQAPLREHLAAQLMLALARSGRRGEALAVYRDTRAMLIETLGTEPDRELQELHHRVLTGRVRSAEVAPIPTVPPTSPVDFLPFDLRVFTGRERELELLNTIVDDDAPTRVAVVSGSAGMGKTAVAVHWAHRVADRYPDGRLYADLRGFGPGEASDPGEVLRTFIEALGDAPAAVPVDLEGRAARFRNLVADKRILLVLDNAGDPAQVRPLLPGAPECAIVVTSRNRLTGLIASTGALAVPLEAMSEPQARALLTGRLGVDRLIADRDPVQRIVEYCAGLPLALSVVAANAASRPGDSLALLAGELDAAATPLDGFGAADPATDPRTLLHWSYRQLSPEAGRLFRLLALHPGPDWAVPAAASTAGTGLHAAQAALVELVEANLLLHTAERRYGFHDLVRAFAIELATRAPDERDAASQRMLDHYLHTAYAADRLLDPTRGRIHLAPMSTGVTPESIMDNDAAMRWFGAETAVLLAAVDHAAVLGHDVHCWQLAWTLPDYLNRRGRWHEFVLVTERALEAAIRLGDTAAQAIALRYLGQTCARLERLPEAHDYLVRSLALCEKEKDERGQAYTHHLLGRLRRRQGRLPEALDSTHRALALFQAVGDRVGQARTLQAIGFHHLLIEDHASALPYCERAVELFRALGDTVSEAAVRDDIGLVHHHLGDHVRALAEFEHALVRFRELGFRPAEAEVLVHLGDTHLATGAHRAARCAWEAALALYRDLDDAEAENVRVRLHGLEAVER